ncbi:MAG TPA: DUF393 domain-containing protein [Vicinamibacterales bacterium]|nr:DUF393 domain-containing protein [Vicinamibacterales bacterium]
MATVQRYHVMYDGGCGLCLATVAWLRRLDWRRRLRFVDFNIEWNSLASSYPELNRDACASAMHVLAPDGRITAGFEGFRTIAWVIPLFWAAAPFLYLPGASPIGRRVYSYIARHRSTTCVLPAARG